MSQGLIAMHDRKPRYVYEPVNYRKGVRGKQTPIHGVALTSLRISGRWRSSWHSTNSCVLKNNQYFASHQYMTKRSPERHALARARDEERVRDGEQREVLRERELVRVQEHDGLVRECREARVDARHDVRDAALELVSLRCL